MSKFKWRHLYILHPSYRLAMKKFAFFSLLYRAQESLANACDNSASMKAPSEEIYSKSMTCDSYSWLIVSVAILLTICEIFSRIEVENHQFHPLHCDCSPLVKECPAKSM